MLITAAALWMLVRALRAEPQRWAPWIAVGLIAGVAMEIKILAAPLLACCLLGVVVVGPRRRLASPRPWVAALIALSFAAPNLIWQATHGLPIASVAANIASGGSTSSTPRAALLPSVLLDVGPIVSIVLIVGLIVLLRTRERRTVDGWLAAGFLIFVVFLLITGGKAYYPAAFYPALLAAGAGPVLDWIRIRMWRRCARHCAGDHLTGDHAVPDTSAWSGRFAAVPDRNRGESGPGQRGGLARLRRHRRSGCGHRPSCRAQPHDRADQGLSAGRCPRTAPPSQRRTPPTGLLRPQRFLVLGTATRLRDRRRRDRRVSPELLSRSYAHCEIRSTVATPPGVRNDLTGVPVRWCTGRLQSWSLLWPELRLLA